MSNNAIIKRAIADALKDLLKQQPLSKISVKQIAYYCDISRNTFYYHFKDKYDLINWIFYSDMLKNANSFTDPTNLSDSFTNVCKCLYKDRCFYLACFQYVGQNSLYEYLFNFYNELFELNFGLYYAEAGLKLSDKELKLLAKLRAHALVGIVRDWINDNMDMSYFEQINSFCKLDDLGYVSLVTHAAITSTLDIEKEEKDKERKKWEKAC